MMDYEKELFVYKYRPKLLSDIKRPIVNLFNKILEKDITPNFILYGQKGSGKKTLLYAFLNSKYGDIKTQCIQREFKINTKKVVIPIFYSPYHIEIDIQTFLSHIRTILPILVKEFSQTKNIIHNQHKLFVIHHIEDLEMQTQHTLRRILEIYMDNCRFIFITSKLNKLTKPLQSRCLIIRVPIFTNTEIKTILSDINKKTHNIVKNEVIEHISNHCNNNLKYAICELESKHFDMEIDVSFHNELETLLVQIINKKPTMSLYENVDEYFYKILYKNISLYEIIRYTFLILKKLLVNDYAKLNEILKKILLYDQNMNMGSRNFIHIQALYYYLIYLFHP